MIWLKSPRILLALSVVAALVVVAMWPSARRVDIGAVDIGQVRETLDAEGRTRLVDRYVLSSPVAGLARRLSLHPGDPVAAGQVVVELDPSATTPLDARSRSVAEAAAAAARARLAAAEEQARAAVASARQARVDAERLAALTQQGLVSRDAAEHAQTARLLAERAQAGAGFLRATAAHEVELAEAALKSGNGGSDAATLSLRAPVSGVLLRRHFESARPVQPGEPLVEIGDPAGLEVEVDVLSSDAVRLREGLAVELLRWGEPQPLQGRVRRVEPGGFTKFSALGVEEQRVWVVVDLMSPFEQWQRLGDAYRVNARFVLKEASAVPRLPSSAVFRHGEGHAVFRVDGGRARLVEVTPGVVGGGFTELLGGPAPGEGVILHPDRLLAEGDRVRGR